MTRLIEQLKKYINYCEKCVMNSVDQVYLLLQKTFYFHLVRIQTISNSQNFEIATLQI